MDNAKDILKAKLSAEHLDKILALGNDEVNEFIAYAIQLCEPDDVWVGTDAPEDVAHCRQLAIDNKEELPLGIKGHTVHRVLVAPAADISALASATVCSPRTWAQTARCRGC